MDFKTVKEKYSKNYIRDDQLVRFRDLGVITEEQYEKLYDEKHPPVTDPDTAAAEG